MFSNRTPLFPFSKVLILVTILVVVFWNGRLVPCSASSQRQQQQPTYGIDTLVGYRYYDGDGGLASHASVSSPLQVVLHPVTGDVCFADSYNHVIRCIDSVSGVISTVAGTPGVFGYGGDGTVATRALLSEPRGVAFSANGGHQLFIADTLNNRVHMVDMVSRIITTVAGDGSLATRASLNRPSSVTVVGTTGELVIADRDNHRIRAVDIANSGIIYTVAGIGRRTGYKGAVLGDDGYAVDASLNIPEVVVSIGNGEILVADRGNFRIRKISTHGMITTVAGTGVEVIGNDGFLATVTAIGSIGGLAIDHDGHVYISDHLGHCVRRIDSTTQLPS